MVQVHAGIFQSYFIDENGSVWVCGENSFGSLGTRNPADVKKFSEPKKMPDLPPIEAIFTGNTYAFLLDYEGWLWACGVNGTLGSLNNDPFVLKKFNQIKGICINAHHCLVLDADCVLWGVFDQCAILPSLFDQVQIIPDLPKFRAILSSFQHSLLLDVDGGVWSTGANGFGQCGRNEKTNLLCNLGKILNIPEIHDIQTGEYHSLLLDLEGNVWSFGYNGEGQLGLESKANIPIKVQELPLIVKIYCGAYFSLAVDQEGTIWGCGSLRFTRSKQKFTKLSELPVLRLQAGGKRLKSARNVR